MEENLQYRKIESLEQEVIQQIRLSGIKSSKETAIIDKILEMRRERRYLFSKISKETTQLCVNADQADALAQQKIENLEQGRIESLHHIDSLRLEIQRLQNKLKSIESSSQLEIAQCQSNFSQTISTLDSKIKELEESNQSLLHNLEMASSEKTNYSESLCSLESQFQQKLKKYKDTLSAMLEKEKSQQEKFIRFVTTIESQKELNRSLQSKLIEKEEECRQLEIKVSQLTQTLSERSRGWDRERRELEEALQTSQSHLEQVEITHQEELSLIDSRVRSTLRSRDEALSRLRVDLEAALTDKQSLVDELEQLQSLFQRS